MIKVLLQLFAGFMLIYVLWIFTGGPERGELRNQAGEPAWWVDVEDRQ